MTLSPSESHRKHGMAWLVRSFLPAGSGFLFLLVGCLGEGEVLAWDMSVKKKRCDIAREVGEGN